jgi:hypothetical protein
MLAKFVFSLYEVHKTTASFKKSLSAAISCLLQENRQPNPYTDKEVYKNLTLVYKKWNNYSRDHPSAIKKAEIFSIEQGTAMLELPTENKRKILDKVVLVLSWYGGERTLDIYKHLSKNISTTLF